MLSKSTDSTFITLDSRVLKLVVLAYVPPQPLTLMTLPQANTSRPLLSPEVTWDLIKLQFRFSRLGMRPEILHLRFPGDTDAAGPRTRF